MKTERVRFKNDNRGNTSNVVKHMIAQAEKQIEKMTGEKIRLVIQKEDYSVC